MSSNNSKPKTEKVVETKQKSTKKCCRSLDLQHFFLEKTEIVVETKAEDVKPEVKAEEIDKLALAKKTLAAEKEKEADKQKGIYSAMGKFTIVRN